MCVAYPKRTGRKYFRCIRERVFNSVSKNYLVITNVLNEGCLLKLVKISFMTCWQFWSYFFCFCVNLIFLQTAWVVNPDKDSELNTERAAEGKLVRKSKDFGALVWSACSYHIIRTSATEQYSIQPGSYSSNTKTQVGLDF